MQIQEAARANRKFFAGEGLRAGAAALPTVSLRTTPDRPPRSGPRSPGQMHAPQPKIACRTHPEMLMAEDAKRAVRYGGSCAEVRQVQSAVGVRLEEIFQSPHDSRVPPVSTANLNPLAFAQTLDHYPGQRL